jgi:rSAM/selenodomain-associated transferase 2
MQFSVIVPTLNEAANIGETIRALKAYGGPSLLEIIVVDGGSNDETCKIAASQGAKVVHCNERSRAAQMNEGARHAIAEVLHFVHADTIVPAEYGDKMMHAIHAGWEMGNFRYDFDKPGKLLAMNAYFTKYSWLVCQGGDKTFFIKKDLFFELGAYDTYWTIMEEYDFVKKASKAGYKIITLPEKCVVSARKYDNNSWLRVQLANFVVFNLWKLGLAKPNTLREVYGKILK